MRNLIINNTGDKSTEYVSFIATEKTSLGHFVIVDSTFDKQGKPSNKLRHFYAFPDHQVEKDDLIVLWTQKGKNNIGENTKKGPQHNFFWNLDEHVWNIDGDTAHLLDVRQALTHKVGKKTA